jgi:repressor LexA
MPTINESKLGDFISEAIESRGWSIRKAAMNIGVSPAYLSKLINKKADSNPKPETLDKLASGLNISKEDIYQHTNYHMPENVIPFKADSVVQIPVVGTIKCGPDGLAMNDFQGREFVSKEDLREGNQYFWLITTGDSMIGDYIQDGDYALIKRGNAFENGDICAVIVDGEEGTLKHVTKNKDSIVLSASNPSYPPRVFVGDDMNDIYIAGTLVEIKHKFK